KRVVLAGTLRPGHRVLRAPLTQEPVSVFDVRTGIVRAQLQSQLVFSFGLRPLPLCPLHSCQQVVRFSQLRIKLQCLPGRAYYLRARLFRWAAAHENCTEFPIRVCQTDVSWGKRRVSPYRVVEITNTLRDAR